MRSSRKDMPGQRMAVVLSGTAASPGLFLALQVQVTPSEEIHQKSWRRTQAPADSVFPGVLLPFCSTWIYVFTLNRTE